MVRTTEDGRSARRVAARSTWKFARLAVACLALVTLFAASGCSGSGQSSSGAGSSTAVPGAHMGGAAATVHVSEAVFKNNPQPWNLKTPESAVRSYLDWTSFGYRIGQSDIATATMGPGEEVRVNALVQVNIQQSRLMDAKLTTITIGPVATAGKTSTVPTKEAWTYSYLSIDKGNKVVGGPYQASYDVTYTVVQDKKGNWIVDSVKATSHGEVK